MKDNDKFEESALAIASLLLFEVLGMQVSPGDTRGAVFAVFVGAAIAWILKRTSNSSRE